jgi:hypothetical protein
VKSQEMGLMPELKVIIENIPRNMRSTAHVMWRILITVPQDMVTVGIFNYNMSYHDEEMGDRSSHGSERFSTLSSYQFSIDRQFEVLSSEFGMQLK